jgi:hypothetical protein
MIEFSLKVEDKKQAVSEEIKKFNAYLLRPTDKKGSIQPMNRWEETMIREYLMAKLSGEIDGEKD